MMNNEDSAKIKIKTTALMCKSFYTDFMPMVQQIKQNLLELKVDKADKNILDSINSKVSEAENLLNFMQKQTLLMQENILNKSMLKSNKVILQTEVTGFSPEEGDKLVEIAAIEIDKNDNPTGAIFHTYINPKRSIPKDVSDVHGLKYSFLKKFTTFEEIKDNFLLFIAEKELISQNIKFDVSFLNYQLGFELQNKCTDTLEMARKKFPGMPNILDVLKKRLKIKTPHNFYTGALNDCLLILEVYKKLKGES